MKVKRFNNLYQLTLWSNLFPINCYLYEEQDELTLIDTGMSASFKGIAKEIEKIGKPLTNIILTHAHDDHVGSLDQLKERFPKVCVSISHRDSRLLEGDKSVDSHEKQTPIKGGIPKNVKTIPDRFLSEGETIGSLKVIETPGHTPGSISLYDTKSNAIIAGDALQTQGAVAVCSEFVLLFPFPAFATWHKELSIRSAKKILDLKPSLLAVGHGKVIINPEKSIITAIRIAEKTLNS